MIRRRIGALLVVAALVNGSGLPSVAQENPEFTVAPGRGSSTDPQGGYFLIPSEPGASLEQTLALRNDGDEALNVRLAGVDTQTSDVGGISYNLEDQPKSDVGAWISLETESVTLAVGETEVIQFIVSVPQEVRSGTHVGGISVWVPKEETTTTPAGPGATIVARTRRVLAVQIDLPAGTGSHLTISGVQPAARPSGLFLDIGIANDGFTLTRGEGFIELRSEGFRQDFNLDTFVPNTSIKYPIKWANAVKQGKFTGHVEIRYDGKLAVWDGSFEVTDKEESEFKERFVPTEGTGPTDQDSLPLWLTAGGGLVSGLLIALGVWLIFFLKRRKKRQMEKLEEEAVQVD